MNNSQPIFITVLIDALGWPCVERYSFLADTLPYRKPLRTFLGYSSGAIPTILTGSTPSFHGHWNLFYFDPAGSPFRWLRALRFLPDGVLDHRITRKVLKEMGRRMFGLGPLFECCVSPRLLPWFNWVERRNIYGPRGIEPVPSIFDTLKESGVPYQVYTYHDLSDQEILRKARRDLQGSAAKFFFVYLSELDGLLHFQDLESEGVAHQVSWYEAELKSLLQAAQNASSDVTFMVCSDHGMTPVKRRFDLIKEIASAGLSMPDDYLAVYDSTMGRFWFFNDDARRRVTTLLASLPCGRILPDAELEQLGIFFPDRRYGELIFLLHPGWLIAHGDFNGKGWNPTGMHGYHPADPFSDAVFLCNRSPATQMQTIADIYPLMAEAACEVRHA